MILPFPVLHGSWTCVDTAAIGFPEVVWRNGQWCTRLKAHNENMPSPHNGNADDQKTHQDPLGGSLSHYHSFHLSRNGQGHTSSLQDHLVISRGSSYATFCLGTKNNDSTSSARESMQSWWIHCNSIGYSPRQLTNILNLTWIPAVNHMKRTSTRQSARIIRSGNICLKHCQAEMWRCS